MHRDIVIRPIPGSVAYDVECAETGDSTTVPRFIDALMWGAIDIGSGDKVTFEMRGPL